MPSEKQICIEIATRLNGKREAPASVGSIDILTDKYLIEVKTALNWKCGIGRLIAYGHDYKSHIKVLYLFNHCCLDNQRIKKIKEICDSANILLRLYSDVNLRHTIRTKQRIKQEEGRKQRKQRDEYWIEYGKELKRTGGLFGLVDFYNSL